jgi:multidrug efflux system outer membrane protein
VFLRPAASVGDPNLYTAQLNLVSAQQGEALTLIQLYDALGEGWQP